MFIASMYFVIAYTTNSIVLTNSFYYSALSVELTQERISEIIELNKRLQWIGYVALPVLVLLKWVIIAGVVYAGVFLFNQKILFMDCFRIIMFAELVLILVAIIKLFKFIVWPPSNMQDVQLFYPFSISNLLDVKRLPSYLLYPLQQLNMFEIAYWMLIAMGIKNFIQKPFGYSLKIVASSYGVALAVWVLAVMFIQLQFAA
jgi:hypothetical protein